MLVWTHFIPHFVPEPSHTQLCSIQKTSCAEPSRSVRNPPLLQTVFSLRRIKSSSRFHFLFLSVTIISSMHSMIHAKPFFFCLPPPTSISLHSHRKGVLGSRATTPSLGSIHHRIAPALHIHTNTRVSVPNCIGFVSCICIISNHHPVSSHLINLTRMHSSSLLSCRVFSVPTYVPPSPLPSSLCITPTFSFSSPPRCKATSSHSPQTAQLRLVFDSSRLRPLPSVPNNASIIPFHPIHHWVSRASSIRVTHRNTRFHSRT